MNISHNDQPDYLRFAPIRSTHQQRLKKHALLYIRNMLIALSLAVQCTAPAAAENLVIGVATVPHSLPFFVAEHEGYFTQDAPNIRLVDCFPGRKCLEQLLAKKFQFATAADTPIVVNSFARADFMVLATFATSNNDIQIVRNKNAGITSLKHLAGKRIGIIKGSSIDYFIDTVLLFDGIDPASVQKIDIAPDDMAHALQQHRIDAFALFDPGLNKAMTAMGNSAAVLPTPPIYLSTFNLVAARAMADKNDADMVKILRVLDRAQRFIKQQPDAAQRILQKRLNTTTPSSKSIATKIDYALSLDQTLIKTLEGEARWLKQQKEVVGNKPTNYLDYIYPSPLLQAKPNAVTLVK